MHLDRLNDPAPQGCLLSNGRYTVLISGAGTGFSACDGYALTHWTADRTEDGDGLFIYVRDLERGTRWSLGHQPVGRPAEQYAARYQCGTVTIARLDDGIAAEMAVCVASDDDVEIRRIRIANQSGQSRRLELTSYAEVVLNEPAAHAAHPAFSKLFVQTEYVAHPPALLAKRRPRSRTEPALWLVHALLGEGPLQYETDRARFIGRGRSLATPVALTATVPLSGTIGSVLDPVVSLRRVLQIGAGQSVQLTLLLGAAPTRDAALDLAARYAETSVADAAFDGAAQHERALLQRLAIPEERAECFQSLAGAMLYGHPALRADTEIMRRCREPSPSARPAPPPAPQTVGASAYTRLVVANVEHADEFPLIHDLVRAQGYWRAKGLGVRVLILCGEPAALADEVQRAIGEVTADDFVVRRLAECAPADIESTYTAAHLVLRGTLLRQPFAGTFVPLPPALSPGATEQNRPSLSLTNEPIDHAPSPLLFDNGYGGFRADGREYIIRVDGQRPPMPWINVVANENFGCLVSESGAGYTWSRNSRENRLTPWGNDPVTDPHGEALYLRDEEAGRFWSPLPGPAPDGAPYEVRHGFGYTSSEHISHELEQQVCLFVPRQDPVKITCLRLTNRSERTRQLSVFAYYRLVLGGLPEDSGRSVVTELDEESTALFAYNRANHEFSNGVVFAAVVPPGEAYAGASSDAVRFTGDRTAFIGRNGCPAAPAAVCNESDLDGRTGAALDPCAAVQTTLSIPPGCTVQCAVLFGEATSDAAARGVIARYREPAAVAAALQAVRDFWTETLSAVQVTTPSPSIDVMMNGWLLYQTISCRLWGRSAFYQSGGAFGFRDQLQDAAALIHVRPDLTRTQIVLHAAHQFVEGDVLHWWHPPTDRGIRTRFSDDLLWLPYLTAFYVQTTGDWGVLDESIGFVTTRSLDPAEDEAYLVPAPSDEVADVYAHCCRALDRSLTCGAHGLPLMGSGDWNDGMNRVGCEGRGESVWVGFFLSKTIDDFVPLCERRGDYERAQRYRTYQARLRVSLNDAGWDGQWYRRAYYDDGTPLGSAENDECRIDALVQAWAVLSKVAPSERAVQAMDAVEQHLVFPDAGLIRLLTPPFDRDPHDPGYIKGYVPGIRENGGQYTHAAIWVVQALAEMGRRDRAATWLEMLGPIRHTRSRDRVAIYQVEPYVVAADIYGISPHTGRGGWTWYTGSAGWMYRVALESVLGLRIEAGHTLWLKPCIPDEWPEFTVKFRLPDGKTQYAITVRNPTGHAAAVVSVEVDGQRGVVDDGVARIPLARDGVVHQVVVTQAKRS